MNTRTTTGRERRDQSGNIALPETSGPMSLRFSLFWTIVAVVTTLTLWAMAINQPFGAEPHAWASAHMAVMARYFADQGVLSSHAVPTQNNPPLGNEPDLYIHWPPLFAILLSVAFRWLGQSVHIVHGFVFAINLLYLAIFYRLVKHCFGLRAAVLSIFGVLVIPVFVYFGVLVWTVNAGMATILFAIYCFVRSTERNLNWGWAVAGVASIVIGTLLSWEPALLGFVLLALALLRRSKPCIQVASAYAAAGLATVAAILGMFVSYSPALREDLLETVRYRLGGAYGVRNAAIHTLVDLLWYTSGSWKQWVTIFDIQMLGVAPSIALIGVLIWAWDRRETNPEQFFVLGGLLGVWVGWFLIFPNHAFNHQYQWLLAAPLGGIAVALGLIAAGETLHGHLQWLSLVVLPIILMVPLWSWSGVVIDHRKDQAPEVAYSLDIRNNTSNGDIILSTSPSMVPVYYSERHMIRYVNNERILRYVNQRVWNVFPQHEVYLAILPGDSPRFPCSLSHFEVKQQDPYLILMKMRPDVCN